MDIIEQLESKIRNSMGRYDELKQKISQLEEENQKLKEIDQERTAKLERLLSSIDESPAPSNSNEDDDYGSSDNEDNGYSEQAQTIDEGEDIF